MADNLVKNQLNARPKVVFSPLDWGLGHTTRSIPLLQLLEALDFELVIACNSIQYKLLHPLFPGARFLPLNGYGIRFGTSRWGTLLRIGFQALKILTKIKSENQWVKHFCLEEKPSFLLSDSRFGFHSSACPSVFITHQVQIKTGLGKLIDRLINRINHHYLRRFNECWVPDVANNAQSLAGELSANIVDSSVKLNYVGPLSRFRASTQSPPVDGPVTLLLSGPEPQRSLLEASLLKEAAALPDSFILVRGLPGDSPLPITSSNIQCHNHLPPDALSQLLEGSSLVISRSGYSSLMDYSAIGCKAILIPTPGQAEQEYLAAYWAGKGWALSFSQEQFSLSTAVRLGRSFSFQPIPRANTDLRATLLESLQRLQVLPAR